MPCKILCFIGILFYTGLSLSGATRYSVASGNWNSTATWSATSGGAPGASVPVNGDAVYIERGLTVTVNVITATCLSIEVGVKNNNAGTLSFNSGAILTVSGNVILGEDKGSGNPTGSLIMTNGGLFRIGGSLTAPNLGTWTPGIGTIEYYSNGTQTVYTNTYNNLTLSGTNAKTTTGVTVNGVLSIEGTATVTAAPTYGASATLQYKGSATQTTGIEFPATFSGTGGLIINNINGVLLSGSYTINSILTLTSGAISLGANTLTLANGSNLSYGGGSLTGGATSNLTIGTGADITLNAISGGLNNFNTSRNITLGADLSVNGTLTLTAGALSIGANTLTLNGPTTAGTPTNLTTTAASSLTFGGSSAGVLIPFSVTNLNNLTINNANGVTVQGPLNMTGIVSVQNGNLSSGGFLTLLSTAGGTALIDGSGTGQVTGNVIMQRYLPSGFGYKYFSSPVQAATVNEFGDDMTLGSPFTPFYRYDENRLVSGLPASGWVSYKTTTNVLNPLAGYAVNFGSVAAPNTVDITGVVNNGNMSVTLYNNNQIYTKGFNLIGNPYPSPIDWNAATGWTKDFIDNALYYFKASTTDQYGGTYRTYINGISSDGIVNNIIPSMQGFFVHVANGTYPVTGTLAMDNSVRITDMTHSFTKKSAGNSTNSSLRLIAGYSDDNASFDPLVIYYDYKATSGFDSQLDAMKLFNTDSKVTNFYSFGNDGARLSVNALPETEDDLITIPLGLKTAKNGDIIFRIRDIEGAFSGKTIYIFDAVTGTNNILLPDNEYRVLLNAGDYNNRFFLNFSNITTDMPDFTSGIDPLTIYSYYGILKAEINIPQGENSILTICNLLGQVILKRNINEPGHYEFSPDIKDGIYIVNFVSANRRVTKKIFLQSK